jgi:hypothetical protein
VITLQLMAPGYQVLTARDAVLEKLLSTEFQMKVASRLSGSPKPDLLRMPGTRLFLTCLATYVANKVESYANMDSPAIGKPKFGRGDYADLTHLVYQPYVDIFCCDRRTKELLRKAKADISNVCVSDNELIERARVR